jgi:hypothetical protein
MSPPKDSEHGAGTTRNGRGGPGDEDPGILSQLPRTRPQRSSRHREAARNGSVAGAASTATPSAADGAAPAGQKTSARTAKKAAPRSRSKAARPSAKRGADGSSGAAGASASTKAPSRGSSAKRRPRTPGPSSGAAPTAPRQGFESEGERASGSVHPPGGAELVASAAEIVGEFAKAGLSTGERLLKDVLSRLPL